MLLYAVVLCVMHVSLTAEEGWGAERTRSDPSCRIGAEA